MEHLLNGFIAKYGYFGTFATLALGVAGLPIPDETLLTYAGYHVFQGNMTYIFTMLSAFLGAAAGITVSYAIGRYLGIPFIRRYGAFVHLSEERLERVHNMFERYGSLVLLGGYFIPGVRHLTAFTAGLSRMNFAKFAAVAFTGALIWSSTFITLGYMLGENWVLVKRYAHQYALVAIIVCVLAAVGAALYVANKKVKSRL